jgi:hypothetical protein
VDETTHANSTILLCATTKPATGDSGMSNSSKNTIDFEVLIGDIGTRRIGIMHCQP